ncbi:MAG: GNAT family N-acetyltransferase [bacterium]
MKAQFLEVVEARYPGLKGRCQWPVIFSAFLEILGEKDGVTLLRAAYKSLSRVKKTPGVKALQLSFERYFRAINETGFLPRRLYFAIKRYHRWHALNPSATQVARIQTLIELYNTYSLQNLEQSYPGVRVQFFRETVFSKSKASLKNSLSDIIRTFRNKDAENEILVHVLSEISTHTKLNKDEELFLTRMTFPHLTPHHSAKLISLPEGGAYKPNLVVFMEDFEGNTHSIRNPASPKEIGRLYRLFKIAKLPVDFLPEHQYLVVLNERLHVIAGLFYRFIKNDHVHMEKIVVDERYRKKGISEGLLNEFFNRLQSLGVGIVTVGFLRPQFFYRFGFQLDRSYGNMVKKLDNLEKEELPKERTVPPVIAEIS